MKRNHLIEVLDHGAVRLIDFMGNDLSIVRNARVSYDAEWRAGQNRAGDQRLIKYLLTHGHNTPFESCAITFEIRAPIFVFRQWHRHRTQSYNELSARYKELPETFYVPEANQITTQSEDNKQMRTDVQNRWAHIIRWMIKRSNKNSFLVYHALLKMGCPRELARSVLPVGTYSHMFATANLHNWYRFLGERLHPHAQHEIQAYAEAILEVLTELYPIATQAFKYNLYNKIGHKS